MFVEFIDLESIMNNKDHRTGIVPHASASFREWPIPQEGFLMICNIGGLSVVCPPPQFQTLDHAYMRVIGPLPDVMTCFANGCQTNS